MVSPLLYCCIVTPVSRLNALYPTSSLENPTARQIFMHESLHSFNVSLAFSTLAYVMNLASETPTFRENSFRSVSGRMLAKTAISAMECMSRQRSRMRCFIQSMSTMACHSNFCVRHTLCRVYIQKAKKMEKGCRPVGGYQWFERQMSRF